MRKDSAKRLHCGAVFSFSQTEADVKMKSNHMLVKGCPKVHLLVKVPEVNCTLSYEAEVMEYKLQYFLLKCELK